MMGRERLLGAGDDIDSVDDECASKGRCVFIAKVMGWRSLGGPSWMT